MDAKSLHEKGKLAEEFIAKLCTNAFQQDFTFKNPIVVDKELCDVLIVLQNKAVIWQIKSLKEKDGKIKNKEVEKAIRQCTGAMRKMKSLQKITLKNVSQESKIVDCSSIDEYYLIVAVEDGIPDFHEFTEDKKEYIINIFFSPFTRFALKYLNTVPDLLDYLMKKEKLLKGKSLIISGGEENLLAHFLGNARSFGILDNPELSSIYFSDEDLATKFENREEVKLRLEEEIKYCSVTDFLIKKRRESISSNPEIVIPQETKDLILSLFLNMNSLEKRMFGKLYHEAALKAYEISRIKTVSGIVATYRSYYLCKKVLYIFGFLGYDSQREKEMRQVALQMTTYGAVKKLEASYDFVMCVGSEIDQVRRRFPSFEWVFLDYREKKQCNDYIDCLFPDLDTFLKELGILQDSTIHVFNQNEYEKSELSVDNNEDIQKYIIIK